MVMAAREAAGDATLLSMGDSCGKQTALGLRWGVCGSSPGNRGNMRSMCVEQPLELARVCWTIEADNSHTSWRFRRAIRTGASHLLYYVHFLKCLSLLGALLETQPETMINRCQGTLTWSSWWIKFATSVKRGKGDCVKLTGNQIAFLWHKGPLSSDADQGQQPVRFGDEKELPGKVRVGSQAWIWPLIKKCTFISLTCGNKI